MRKLAVSIVAVMLAASCGKDETGSGGTQGSLGGAENPQAAGDGK